MNTADSISPSRRRGESAFTLPEVMVVMAIMSMVSIGLVSAHIYGIKMLEVVQPRLGVCQDARKALTLMMNEVRSASSVDVGAATVNSQGALGSFTRVSGNVLHRGNALHINLDRAGSNWVRYYHDANASVLRRTQSGIGGQRLVMTHLVTNTGIFTLETPFGAPCMTDVGNPVVCVTLQFSQIEYPVTQIGPGRYFDYYVMETRITPRRN